MPDHPAVLTYEYSPRLSVITPSLNSEEFIEDAILSVSRQQGVAVEHIVIDGASTDNTLAIVKRYSGVRGSRSPTGASPMPSTKAF